MTATEVKALTDRELDALIAEKVMGWHKVSIDPMGWYDVAGNLKETVKGFRPSTDRNAAALALERIRELDLAEKCSCSLGPVVPKTNSYAMQIFEHMTAPARLLMEAALLALEESK